MLAGRLDRNPSFMHIVAAWLLDVHVLTRLASPDRDQRMPMVGRGDGHRVEVLVVQGLANVLHRLGCVARLVLDPFGGRGEQPAVGIDNIADLDSGQTDQTCDVSLAPAIYTGNTYADAI